ncbi:MAG: hypothetical protein WCO56_14390 [Verrucomicrobiota bacterium]
MSIEIGTAFQLVGDSNHPWFVVSKVMGNKVLAVNITDAEKCSDRSCLIGVAEHPIVTKPSAVFYKKAREFDAKKLEKELDKGLNVRRLEKCEQRLLERIIQGALKSDDLTAKFLRYVSHK